MTSEDTSGRDDLEGLPAAYAAWRESVLGRNVEHLETTEKVKDVQRQMLDAAAGHPRDRGELADRLRDGRF